MALIDFINTVMIIFISLAARNKRSTRKTLSTLMAVIAVALANKVSGMYPISTRERSKMFQPSEKKALLLSAAKYLRIISIVNTPKIHDWIFFMI